MKYTWKFKLDCVTKYKSGDHIDVKPGKSRRSFMSHVADWARCYDDLGIDGLKHGMSNRQWTPEERFAMVAKVIAGRSVNSVASESHVNPGQLYQWVYRYRQSGMAGLQCRKGRKPAEQTMKPKKERPSASVLEELAILRERNLDLEMENEYLKKLDALVTEREAAHPKAKVRKRRKK
jgi:transposase-like protein